MKDMREENENKLNKERFKNEGFSLPQNYFESFPDKMQKRITSQGNVTWKVVSVLQFVLKPQFALAACVLLIAIGLWWFQNKSAVTVPSTTLIKEIKNDSILKEIKKVNAELVVKAMDNMQVDEIEEVVEKEDTIFNAHRKTEIAVKSNQDLDELIEEGIDEDLIMEELLRD